MQGSSKLAGCSHRYYKVSPNGQTAKRELQLLTMEMIALLAVYDSQVSRVKGLSCSIRGPKWSTLVSITHSQTVNEY